MPKLLVRLDDACPTMDHRKWDRMESVLSELGVRPIVGVIPDCQDPELNFSPGDDKFWSRVRGWQTKGWTVAMHGYQHVMQTNPMGRRGLIPFHARGEFVGLSVEQQSQKLQRAWALLQSEKIDARLFMAPAHSLDENTVIALRAVTPLRWITDGLSFRSYQNVGMNWLPQQLGRVPKVLPPGTWTLCLHPNTMKLTDIERLSQSLARFKGSLIAFDDIGEPAQRHGLIDWIFESTYFTVRRFRSWRARLMPRVAEVS